MSVRTLYCTTYFTMMIEPLVVCGALHVNFNSFSLYSIYVHFISCSALSGTCNLSGNCDFARNFQLAMNSQRFEKVTFWEDFSYDTRQQLTLNNLNPEDQSGDHSALFGEDFGEYCAATEVECTAGMSRGTLFNFDTDATSPTMCHFWFFIALPLTRTISFLTTKMLRTTDFPFTGTWLPLNLSLNARSAIHFLS